MMSGRLFDPEKHLPVIKGWADAIRGWVPPKEVLPPTGVMICEDEVPCACGFLYMAVHAPCSSINWLFVNPLLHPVKKNEAVHAVFAYLSMMSIDENRPIIAFYGKGGISRIAQKHGFSVVDKEVSLSFKPIDGENLHE